MAQNNLRRKDEPTAFVETSGYPPLEVAAQLSQVETYSLPVGMQFAEAPPYKRINIGWIVRLVLAGGLMVLGSAMGHPFAAIAILAIAALVAWGNWIIDNTIM